MALDSDYRRGQVFGFTIAEILLLLLFILLLSLFSQIMNEKAEKENAQYKLDLTEKEYTTLINKLYSNIAPDDEVIVIKEKFRQMLEEEQANLKQDQLKFKELEQILLAAGSEIFDETNDLEKIKKLKESLKMGGMLKKAGFDESITEEDIQKLKGINDYLNDPNNIYKDHINALEAQLEECRIQKKGQEDFNKACTERVKALTGGDARQPCWVSDDGGPVALFNVYLEEDGWRVTKTYNSLDDKPFTNLILRHEKYLDKVIKTRSEFLKTFDAFKIENIKKTEGTSCIFTANYHDKLKNIAGSKTKFQSRITTGFIIFESQYRMKKIWGATK